MNELKLISDLKNIELKTETNAIKYGLEKKYIVNSGKYKGELLFTELKKKDKTVGFPSAFFLDKANNELANLFEKDVKEFSINGAKAFKTIFQKHGITNPKKWLEEKMLRQHEDSLKSPYYYNPDMKLNEVGQYNSRKDIVEYRSLSCARFRIVRAHEMAHKISQAFVDEPCGDRNKVGRTGLLIYGIKEKVDKKTNQIHYIGNEIGRALNEGVTNLVAQRLSGENYFKFPSYMFYTLTAWTISKLMTSNTVFEAFFFDPKLLKDKWNLRFHNKYAYTLLVAGLDINYKYLKLSNIIKEALMDLINHAKRILTGKSLKIYQSRDKIAPTHSIIIDNAKPDTPIRKSAIQTLNIAHEELSVRTDSKPFKVDKKIL